LESIGKAGTNVAIIPSVFHPDVTSSVALALALVVADAATQNPGRL